MEIHREARGHIEVLRPDGRLDRKGSRELDEAATALIADGREQLVIDLSTVGGIDSDGIRCLLRLARRLEAGDGNLILCRLPAPVTEAFAISGVSDDFRIVPHVGAACVELSPERLRRSNTSRAAARILGLRSRGTASQADADEMRTAELAADLLRTDPSDRPASPTDGGQSADPPPLPDLLAPHPPRKRSQSGADTGSRDRQSASVEPAGLGGKLSDWLAKLKK